MTLQPTEHTRIDGARISRTGIPEVVYAQSKTLDQIEGAMRALWDAVGEELLKASPGKPAA